MKNLLFFFVLLIIIQPGIAGIADTDSISPSENTIDNMYCIMGNDYLDKGEFSNALGSFTYALQQNPNNTIALNGEGIALSRLGREDDAIQFYDKVLALNPNSEQALNNKGLSLAHLGRFEESLQAIDKLLSINPNNLEGLATKSSIQYNLGRYQESLQTSEKALSINPNRAVFWIAKGNALSGLKRYNEAIESFDKAIVLAPVGSPDAEGAKQNKAHNQALLSSSLQTSQVPTSDIKSPLPSTTKSPQFFLATVISLVFIMFIWKKRN
jgi:tetratricopeptide (TPR) repeat protein